uniref:Uncharacterized protein n=1 Tax=Caenorhabditis tropicalis TaxID=1561998 RepID=A0A1I7TE77_9PELO
MIIIFQYLKETNLDIPSEFSEFDGYLFINDVNPICSAKESLLLRICFTKNPTRVFGRPQMLETSDGTLYQFAVNDRFMSSSDCLISVSFYSVSIRN